jgi:hypothetical protein
MRPLVSNSLLVIDDLNLQARVEMKSAGPSSMLYEYAEKIRQLETGETFNAWKNFHTE